MMDRQLQGAAKLSTISPQMSKSVTTYMLTLCWPQGRGYLAPGSTSPAARQLPVQAALAPDTHSAALVQQQLHVKPSSASSSTHNSPLCTLGSGAWSPSRSTMPSLPVMSTRAAEPHPAPLPPPPQQRIWSMVQAAFAPTHAASACR